MRKTLSVVLATYNEEKNLPSCLDSIKDLADEIIIVDGTSFDKTVEIAKKYNAKVKITTNKSNFHINKQMAIDMATSDWILQLDADEQIGPESKKEIEEILKIDEDINGYWMPRKNWFLGRFLMKGGQYPDYTIRFYKRGKGRLPQKDVHEQAEVEGKVAYLKEALLHYPYKNFSHYVKKWNSYNVFFSNQIKEEFSKKNYFQKTFAFFDYLLIKPIYWFLLTFLRHKGIMDSWQGFVFSLFSALRFPFSYVKYFGWYKMVILIILFLATFLRFYNFPNRWGLSGDDGRDVIVGLEALRRHELPLVGPFSSAGPFVFGPLFYWFIMASFLILPFLMSSPWFFLGALGVATVFILVYASRIIGGRKLAVIVGLFAATSPQLVVRSLILGPHSFIPFFASLLILNFLLLFKKKKSIYGFYMGLSLGIAISMHYQALNLLIFFPALFFIPKLSFKKKLQSFLLMLIGFIIPSAPLLYWDSFQNFANIRNILDYFLIAQYRIYVPNSWKLFILTDMPYYWSFVIGRFNIIALILFIMTPIVFIYSLAKRKIESKLTILGIIFFIFLFVNRFYKGERSEGYLLYLIPFIIIFSSWLFVQIFFSENIFKASSLKRAKRILGVIFICIIIFSSFITIRNLLSMGSMVNSLKLTSKLLSDKYPGAKFSIYDYKEKSYSSSMALSYIMDWEGKINKKGVPILVGCYDKECLRNLPVVFERPILVNDLTEVLDINNSQWISSNREQVYDNLIGWLNKNQLESTFSLKKYIIEKIRL